MQSGMHNFTDMLYAMYNCVCFEKNVVLVVVEYVILIVSYPF